jgi:hypothetical protein
MLWLSLAFDVVTDLRAAKFDDLRSPDDNLSILFRPHQRHTRTHLFDRNHVGSPRLGPSNSVRV